MISRLRRLFENSMRRTLKILPANKGCSLSPWYTSPQRSAAFILVTT